MRRIPGVPIGVWLATAFLLALNQNAAAQQDRRFNNLPDAPVAKQAAAQSEQKTNNGAINTTLEILGRKSVFFPELAHDFKPLSTRQKLELAADQSIAPYGLIVAGFTAGIAQARDTGPRWRSMPRAICSGRFCFPRCCGRTRAISCQLEVGRRTKFFTRSAESLLREPTAARKESTGRGWWRL